MKIRIAFVLLLSTAFSPAAFPAHANSSSPMAFQVSKALVPDAQVEPGATKAMVTASLGAPYLRLSSNLWIYRDFKPDPAQTRTMGCNILLVRFENGMVNDLQLVNRHEVGKISASLKHNRPMRNVAGTQ